MPYREFSWSGLWNIGDPDTHRIFGPFYGPVWVDWLRALVTYPGPGQRPSCEVVFCARPNIASMSPSNDVVYPREFQSLDPSTTSPQIGEGETKIPVCRASPFNPTWLALSYEPAGAGNEGFSMWTRIWTA